MTLPLAHIGHWLWTLYLIPVAIVVGAIVKSKLSEKRHTDGASTVNPENPGDKSAPPAGGTGREAENVNLARRPPSPRQDPPAGTP